MEPPGELPDRPTPQQGWADWEAAGQRHRYGGWAVLSALGLLVAVVLCVLGLLVVGFVVLATSGIVRFGFNK